MTVQLEQGASVMARVAPGEVTEGIVREVSGDCYTVALFEGTTEIELPAHDVWRNGYSIEPVNTADF